jgi:LacI family transcriptional regulator
MQFENLSLNASGPLSSQLASIIENKILNKELLTGQKLPTQPELRKIFKVSNNTINEALSTLTRAGYISRRPNYGTVVISSEPNKTIDLKTKNELGVIIGPVLGPVDLEPSTHPRYLNMLIGIEEKIKERGLYMVYRTIGYDFDLSFLKKEIAGLILAGNITPKVYRQVLKTGVPFILVGDIFADKKIETKVDMISDDDFQITYLAARHLIELGHRRIVFITVPTKYAWDREEMEGYRKALDEAGIGYDKSLQIEVEEYSVDSASRAMKRFLERSIPFTALINGFGENICYGAVNAIREKGMKIPEDVSVVCRGVSPDLTLVTHNFRESGRMAVERLLNRINNPDWVPGRTIIPASLIIRDSTRKI